MSQFLAQRLDHLPATLELEDRFRRGEIGNLAVAAGTATNFRDRSIGSIEALLADARLIGGIGETVDQLRGMGCRLILATITWTFASRYFARRFGFDAWCGTVMGERSGALRRTSRWVRRICGTCCRF